MSQDTVVIANTAGASLRANINLAYQALISNNSGASAPAIMYPFMLWADTAGILKQRNAANTAWINLWNLATADSDIYTTAWTDYGATSTVVGFSSITTKKIYTKKIGKLCFVKFSFDGISNANNLTFTLPFTSAAGVGLSQPSGYLTDNSIVLTAPGLINLDVSSSTVSLFKTLSGGVWTTSGAKNIFGEFFYQTT